MKTFAAVTLVIFLCCLEVALSYPRSTKLEEKSKSFIAERPGYYSETARAQRRYEYLVGMARADDDDDDLAKLAQSKL